MVRVRVLQACLYCSALTVVWMCVSLQASVPPTWTFGHPQEVRDVAVSSEAGLVATACYDTRARLWDLESGRLRATLEGHSGRVLAVDFSPDGRIVATGSSDRTARVWEVQSGQLLHLLEGHQGDIVALAFSPDGALLASACADRSVRLWDAGSGALIRELIGHAWVVAGVAFSPAGDVLATGSWDRTIRLWDVGTGELLQTMIGHENFVRGVAFSADGTMIASSSWDGTVRLWERASGREVLVLLGHAGAVFSIAFAPRSDVLASSSVDGTIRLWSTSTGEQVSHLQQSQARVMSLAFSSDGAWLVSGGYDHAAHVWSTLSLDLDLGLAQWETVLVDDFTDLTRGWYVHEDELAHWEHERGIYRIAVRRPQTIVWSRLPGAVSHSDVSVEATLRAIGWGEMGLMIRFVDRDNFVLFTVRPDGHYRLQVRSEGAWRSMSEWNEIPDYAQGEPVEMRVTARGPAISLHVDGKLLETTHVSSPDGGEVSLCVASLGEPSFAVEFTRLIVRVPIDP